MLLGGAAGDALGAAIEFSTLDEIRRAHGPDGITAYAPAYGRVGAWTDDTQMTLFTAEGLIEAHASGKSPTETIWSAYRRWYGTQTGAEPGESGLVAIAGMHARRAPGNTCISACAGPNPGTPEAPINDSKGCGGVMRVAPTGVVPAPFHMACATAAMTHGHPSGWLAAGALAVMLESLVQGADKLEAVAAGHAAVSDEPRSQEVVALLERALHPASTGRPRADHIEALGAGWVAEEALAIASYCFLVSDDFSTAIIRAANHSGDSDSTGSITGQLFGAYGGMEAIASRWLDELEMGDVIDDIACQLAGIPSEPGV